MIDFFIVMMLVYICIHQHYVRKGIERHHFIMQQKRRPLGLREGKPKKTIEELVDDELYRN